MVVKFPLSTIKSDPVKNEPTAIPNNMGPTIPLIKKKGVVGLFSRGNSRSLNGIRMIRLV